MKQDLKLASNLSPFSKLVDRFVPNGYSRDYDLNKQLAMLAAVDGIPGAALGWPCDAFKNGAEIRRSLAEHGLVCCTLEPDIYTDARFRHGSLTNPDPKIRRESIDRAKSTLDAAEEAGASDINFWMAHDGWEYFFQSHYADAWKWLVEGLAEIAEHNPRMRVSLEPKCKEPRVNNYVANTGTALFLVNKIGKPNLGITLDFGHSIAALESPAEAAVRAIIEGRLNQVHLNDNYRDWDHDLIPGAVNVWDTIEFFYWVRKAGYAGWYSIDIFPYRDDGTEVLQRTVQICRKCCRVADKLIEMNVESLIREGKHVETLGRLWGMVGD